MAELQPRYMLKRPRSPIEKLQEMHMAIDPDIDLDNMRSQKRYLSEVRPRAT